VHPVLFQLGSLVVPSYGAAAAIGVLLALALVQFTAKRSGLDPRHAWNMLVLLVFAALAASRLLLIVMNLSDLRHHPEWLLAIAMVHHPLLTAAGLAGGLAAVLIYARWARLPLRPVADCLAAPLSLAMACEQVGALLAGSDFGSDTTVRWAVTYTNPLAARWSGTPLETPVHPVQAYAAIGAFLVATLTFFWLQLPRRRPGDAAGVWLIATGALLFLTELFRDWEGRAGIYDGPWKNPVIDVPQLVALGMVLAGALMLTDWRRTRLNP
jgi:phosphatidylglycerol:prolipoprotein diacylglycerol transferase